MKKTPDERLREFASTVSEPPTSILATAHAPQPELLTYEEAAAYLRRPLATLRSMVHRKQVPYIRIGKRTVLFRREALAAWLAAGEHRPHDQEGRSG